MEQPAHQARRIVEAMMAEDAFSRWLGIEVVEAAPGRSVLRMAVRREMCNGFGIAHGGIAYSLADSALAFASNAHGRVAVALDNSIHYPAPVQVGDALTATAEERSITHRTAAYDVTVTNTDGTPVAFFRGTVYRTSREH